MSANSFYFAGQQPASQAPGLSFNGAGGDTNNSNNNINSDSLASNNPFRNYRATSPGNLDAPFPSTPTSPFDDPMQSSRPLSRNPFLDQPPAPRPVDAAAAATGKTQSLTAEEIFGSLTLDDSPAFSAKQPADPQLLKKRPTDRPAPARRESESQASTRLAAEKHRPTRSQEEALRARKPVAPNAKPATTRPSLLDDSPPRKPVQRRPRRNSDSSVMDFDSKSLTAEEKRMIEAKRRERSKGKTTRPSRKMDIIDQLDATSIYGTGLFHHDGPFDALNPHRNRQNSKKLSPMQAFPEGSLNNTLGGSGPLNAQADHATFMGHGNDEAFRDFATSGKGKAVPEPVIFDPQARAPLVHGDESHGLGTSTFLEGTPAARSAIVRRQAEQAQEMAEGGLQRKKSLAQRIRQRTRPDYSNRPMPGHGRYDSDDFGFGEERITVPRPPPREREGRLSPPPMPRRNSGSAVEQRSTGEGLASPVDKPSGLLGRMKSLKGGRRPNRNADGGMAT
ncbi:Pal1 domain-containing protein [Trichoderma novae-zelandiae]